MSPPGPWAPRARIAALLTVGFVSVAGFRTSGAAAEKQISLPLEAESLDGREVAIQGGAPALHVVFFATWCPPCVDELRGLADLEARWVDRGYRLLLVAVPTRETRERLVSFVREKSPPGEILFDRTGSAAAACGADRLPLHVIFNAKGEVALRSEGLADGVDAAVDRLLGGRHRAGAR